MSEDRIMTEKCDFPNCEKESKIRFATGDGITHNYCSVEHANDHRNILIAVMMKKGSDPCVDSEK